jgi:hypothetical protein
MRVPALFLLLVLLLICGSAFALDCGNASFSTIGQSGQEDILIYAFDGVNQTLVGQYNTSSPDVPMPCGDFNIVVRPTAANLLSNPGGYLADLISYAQANAISLLFIGLLIGVAVGSRR